MTSEAPDRFASARSVADAVLYEGYVLYPYRASSRKNQIRFQFGVLTPRAYSESDGFERWSMRTECLVDVDLASSPSLSARIRCLQVQHRSVEEAIGVRAGAGTILNSRRQGCSRSKDTLTSIGMKRSTTSWISRLFRLSELPVERREECFRFEAATETELVRGHDSEVAGRIVRRREPVDGRVLIDATDVTDIGEFGAAGQQVGEGRRHRGERHRSSRIG